MDNPESKTAVRAAIDRIKKRPKSYWVRVIVFAGLGILANLYLTKHTPALLTAIQMGFSSEIEPVRTAQTANAAVVLISDEDYWKGPLSRRAPIKRDFLGKLVERLCGPGQADLVALDFIFRSPALDGTLQDNKDYLKETDALANSINKVTTDSSSHCKIILPVTLSCPPNHRCTRQETILDGRKFPSDRVSWGNINLLRDTRQVPGPAPMVDGTTIDSLTGAIVRAIDPDKLPAMSAREGEFPYGTYMTMSDFNAAHGVLQSDEVNGADDRELFRRVHAKFVLIGAGWSSDSYHTGTPVDSHQSPAGLIPGVLLHLNYVAAVLDGRLTPKIAQYSDWGIDVLVVALIALTFAALGHSMSRWAVLAVVIVFFVALQYLTLRLFGRFFDCTIPIVVLFLHWFADEQHHQHEHIRKLEQANAELERKLQAGKPSSEKDVPQRERL